MSQLKKSDFDFELPNELIAKVPVSKRTDSRLLVVGSDSHQHLKFAEIVDFFREGDVLVINDTKVVKARLMGTKETASTVEALVERFGDDNIALCRVRPKKRVQIGQTLDFSGYKATVTQTEGEYLRLEFDTMVTEIMDQVGRVPIPPYLGRQDTIDDQYRYQTVYAQNNGAIAAPTAGLHFDDELLAQIRRKGVSIVPITLHVGSGTFQPLRTENLEDVELYSEQYNIPTETIEAIDTRSGRCIAVGTTVVRTLEHFALTNSRQGHTKLFIKPGFRFQMIDALITNFHLPESTLIMLVCAFVGYSRTMSAYQTAIANQYRFYSYGDAMWCESHEV